MRLFGSSLSESLIAALIVQGELVPRNASVFAASIPYKDSPAEPAAEPANRMLVQLQALEQERIPWIHLSEGFIKRHIAGAVLAD